MLCVCVCVWGTSFLFSPHAILLSLNSLFETRMSYFLDSLFFSFFFFLPGKKDFINLILKIIELNGVEKDKKAPQDPKD